MTILESSQDKVQQLCDLLHNQAIEPAQKQAREILAAAQRQADEIIQQARTSAAQIIIEATEKNKRAHEVADTALKQAAKQAVQTLRLEIENTLLAKNVHELATQVMSKEEIVAGLLKAYMGQISKQGIQANFVIEICQQTDIKKLSEILGAELMQSLKEGKLLQVLPHAGLKLQLRDRHLALDCSDSTLADLLMQFLRKDLRAKLFEQS